jgi:hypothetical protein
MQIPKSVAKMSSREQNEWLDFELKNAEKYADELRKMKRNLVYAESKMSGFKFVSEDRADLAKMK